MLQCVRRKVVMIQKIIWSLQFHNNWACNDWLAISGKSIYPSQLKENLLPATKRYHWWIIGFVNFRWYTNYMDWFWTGSNSKIFQLWKVISMVSRHKGPTRHAYAWQIGPIWQDTRDMRVFRTMAIVVEILEWQYSEVYNTKKSNCMWCNVALNGKHQINSITWTQSCEYYNTVYD